MHFREAIKILLDNGVEDAIYDARMIFSRIGGIPEWQLVGNNPKATEAVEKAIMRRAEREPLQYILGEVLFFGESYTVSPDCLIPRADTEILVEYAVSHIPQGSVFADLCTGSGCVAISTLCHTKSTKAIAVDISDGALTIARQNAERANVTDRIALKKADILDCEPYELIQGESIFAVLSNPPYVKSSVYEELEPEIYHEPRLAFVGGEDGCDFYRAITAKYKNAIDRNGFIAYEIGYDQAEALIAIAADCGMSCEIINDLSGNPRVAVLKN